MPRWGRSRQLTPGPGRQAPAADQAELPTVVDPTDARDMGYEAIREQTLARQKELGIVPPDTELPPINPIADQTGPDGEPFRRWT